MADILCGYTADRDETLVAYLYGDIEDGQRAAFEAHIATCERCRHELADLQSVRGELQAWTAPAVESSIAVPMLADARAVSRKDGRRMAWPSLPWWAQAAAAMLVLGVSAGIANLDVHYDRSGLTVRTGWSRTAGGAAATDPAGASTPVPKNATAVTPWRVDLDALEHRLRTEFHAVSNASAAAVARDEKSLAGSDTQLLRKVRMLLEESERKQRNELALGLAQVVQEFDAKRGTDLADIRTLKNAQTATGVEIVRTQQYVDLLRRASLQR